MRSGKVFTQQFVQRLTALIKTDNNRHSHKHIFLSEQLPSDPKLGSVAT